MNETFDHLDEDEQIAIERELMKLRPAPPSRSLESRIERSLARTTSTEHVPAASLRWQGWHLASLAAAACLAVVAAWWVSRPSSVEPVVEEPAVVFNLKPASPQSLLALNQAMAQSSSQALKAVDDAARFSSGSRQGVSKLRAGDAAELATLLNQY